jgi:hypothetical protein
MGQKTNPIGLRVGIHRKWASSWYNYEKGSFINKHGSLTSKGVINIKGGSYINGVESFIDKLIKHKLFTNYIGIPQLIPVDFRFYKGFAGYTYGFLIYTKFITKVKQKN